MHSLSPEYLASLRFEARILPLRARIRASCFFRDWLSLSSNLNMALMLPLPFRQSRGRALAEVLPAELHAEYERSKDDMGVHGISRYRVATTGQDRKSTRLNSSHT